MVGDTTYFVGKLWMRIAQGQSYVFFSIKSVSQVNLYIVWYQYYIIHTSTSTRKLAACRTLFWTYAEVWMQIKPPNFHPSLRVVQRFTPLHFNFTYSIRTSLSINQKEKLIWSDDFSPHRSVHQVWQSKHTLTDSFVSCESEWRQRTKNRQKC